MLLSKVCLARSKVGPPRRAVFKKRENYIALIAFVAGVLLTVTLSLPGSQQRSEGITLAGTQAFRQLAHEHTGNEHASDDDDEHGGEHAGEHAGEHTGEHSGHGGHGGRRGHGDHEGHGGHGGDGGHGSHHVVADSVTFTVSLMLFMFLTVDMVFLYFVNFPDPNIRQFSWSMLSTTISIFCAVLLNKAAISFFLEQLLPSPFPRGFNMHVGHRENIVVATGLFVFCFTMLSVAGYYCQHDKRYLFAVQGIGGHITGFAFIAAGGHWQEIFEEQRTYVYLVTLGFFVVAAIARVCSVKARKAVLPEHGHMHWAEEVAEGEDEAFALAIGFLISQCALFHVTDKLQPMHGVTRDHTLIEVYHLLFWVVACLVLLVASSFVRSRMKGIRTDLGETGCTIERIVSFGQHLSAFSAGWMMLKVFEWTVTLHVKNMALGMIIDAFVVTMISMVMIYFLDMCADKLTENLDDHATMNQNEDSSCPMDPNEPESSTVLRSVSEVFQEDAKGLLLNAHSQAFNKSNHERALRTIMGAFSFLTGLSWEKAFDSANDCVIEGVPLFRNHRVLSKITFSVCLVLLVFPAWLMYIVPKAMQSWRAYAKIIQRENEEREMDKDDCQQLH